jgi:RNA polymerase sigma factor (sigma-70 family)
LYAVEPWLRRSFPQDVVEVVAFAVEQVAYEATNGTRTFGSFKELVAFTLVVAQCRAIDHIRRRQAERRAASATESIEGWPELVSPWPTPLELADAQDVARLLLELAASCLRERPARLLKGFYFEGLTQEELATRHNIPLGTVGGTLRRALKRLRAAIEAIPGLRNELREAL